MNVRSELVSALAKSALLQELARNCPQTDHFRDMLSKAEVELFRAGDVIIRQGQQNNRIFFLAAGAVRVEKNGKEVCLLSRVGEVFGELATLTGRTRSASVLAVNTVTCVTIQPELAEGLNEEENSSFKHALQSALMDLLADRLQETTSEVAKLRDDLQRSEAQNRVLLRGLGDKEVENNSLRSRLKRSLGFMQTHRNDPDT